MRNSQIKNEQMKSLLGHSSLLKPKGTSVKKNLIATVLLTSLVDAFSILVIYLIFNTAQTNHLIKMSKKIKLPQATQALMKTEKSVVIKVEGNRYFIDGKQYKYTQIFTQLKKLKTESNKKKEDLSLIIQADRKSRFDQINPIIVSSSSSGFEKIKFAVVPKGVANE